LVGGEAGRFLDDLRAGTRIAGYELEEPIGTGGMAVVFRARDERLNRQVALKILLHSLEADEAFRQRFLRESRAAAAIDDPHIVPVFAAGEADGALFIAMRYVPGGDLRTLMRRAGPLSPPRAAAIVSSVASALDAAHGDGLVHRDVKPSNILVDARPGRPDHVYLSDFGLSKEVDSAGLTGSGQFLGSPGYTAPEQMEGNRVDGRADQYSLACTTFELLSGAPVFPRYPITAVIWAHMSKPPPLLTSRQPGLPAAVDGVLAKALAKAPGDRYGSCREFADAVRTAFGLAPYSSEPGIPLQVAGWGAAGEDGTGSAASSSSDETTFSSGGSRDLTQQVRRKKAPHVSGRSRSLVGLVAGVQRARTPRAYQGARPRYRGYRSRRPRQPGVRSQCTLKSRLIAPSAIVIAAVAMFFAVSPLVRPAAVRDVAHTVLPPSPTSYLGIYVTGRPAWRPVARFADAVGAHPDLAGYVSRWGEIFLASFARADHRHGATPLVQFEPDPAAVPAITAGDYDNYLRLYATSVRNFGYPVVIGFGHDMHQPGRSWAHSHVPPATFIAAWRHIVNLFRRQGADNVSWLWTVRAGRADTRLAACWWPGARYVTWVGIDGSYSRPSDTFATVFGRTIHQMRRFTTRPILLSVALAGPASGQAAVIDDLFTEMRRYKTLGLIWSGKDQPRGAHPNQVMGHEASVAFRLGTAELNLVRP
jgi:serine/threonine protein kinase